MTGLAHLLGWLGMAHQAKPVEVKYRKAMAVSEDLLTRMREASRSTDAARAVMADIWLQNHNVPFLTTVYESVQEAKSPTSQRPEDQ